jgi:hypothetical protein
MFVASVSYTFASVEDTLSDGANIQLSCSYVRGHSDNTSPHRMPMRMPIINITGNTITIPNNLIGYEMEIVSEDEEEIFSTTTCSNEIMIPDNLSGYYQIEFIGDYYCYYGEILI